MHGRLLRLWPAVVLMGGDGAWRLRQKRTPAGHAGLGPGRIAGRAPGGRDRFRCCSFRAPWCPRTIVWTSPSCPRARASPAMPKSTSPSRKRARRCICTAAISSCIRPKSCRPAARRSPCATNRSTARRGAAHFRQAGSGGRGEARVRLRRAPTTPRSKGSTRSSIAATAMSSRSSRTSMRAAPSRRSTSPGSRRRSI